GPEGHATQIATNRRTLEAHETFDKAAAGILDAVGLSLLRRGFGRLRTPGRRAPAAPRQLSPLAGAQPVWERRRQCPGRHGLRVRRCLRRLDDDAEGSPQILL